MPEWDILGFGAVAVDDLLLMDSYPPPDSKMPVREVQREGGGLAGTALVAAARLGARAAYAGVLGDDELSRFTIEGLQRAGVDCTPVRRRLEARPYHSTIIVDMAGGHRTILFTAAGVTSLTADEVSEELIAGCRLLFVDSTVAALALHVLGLAHALGIPVVADLERFSGPAIPDLIQQVDHLIVSKGFACQVTGETEPAAMVRALHTPTHTVTAVTAGERGCWFLSRETGDAVRHQPACRVQVVDTTGCGDVFHGAYAAAIVRGASVARAITVATAAAGLKATQPGGRKGIPTWEAVERIIQEQGLEPH
jgi:sugar/nucleoside kinase (ribokinase family)